MRRWTRIGAELAPALAAFAAGVALAWHHPSHPELALAGFLAWCAVALRWPGLWLFVLPAALPVASFSPWTGWTAFDEFDLIVLGALAAGHMRLAAIATAREPASAPARPRMPQALRTLAMLCVAVTTVAALRGFTARTLPAPGGLFDAIADPIAALRVAKGPLLALLLLPQMRRSLLRPDGNALQRFAAGMLVGIGIVVAAVLWERATFTGLFDFSAPYRTTALFWEMNLGGAAIDAYLALAVPFVLRAVVRARTPGRFWGAAALALLAEYACLTTFSRGVYLGIAVGLLVAGSLLAREGDPPGPPGPSWRRLARLVLLAVAIGQVFAVFGSDSFMLARMKRGPLDLGTRWTHWSRGLGLPDGPADWLLGIGLGRFPGEYAAKAPPDEFSGRAGVVAAADGVYLQIQGPPTRGDLAGLYSLTQQVALEPVAYRAILKARAARPVRIGVSVCEAHLLYEGPCRRATASISAAGGSWQRLTLTLNGPDLPRGILHSSAVFAITVLDAGGVAQIHNIALYGRSSANLLSNADFSGGLAHWFPVAKDYFVPWHIDNLALEILIEQGIFGLVAYSLLFGFALVRLFGQRQRDRSFTPFLLASLVGVLLVGLVSSVFDMPRVAFLFVFITLLSAQVGDARPEAEPG